VFMVHEQDGDLVGYLRLSPDSLPSTDPRTYAEIATLFVQEHCLGRETGSELLGYTFEFCAKPEFGQVWLTEVHDNTWAARFYEVRLFRRNGPIFLHLDNEQHGTCALVKAVPAPSRPRPT
jgi:N-acetylglutamate synthase-like GNAT family acetyltransferase